MEDKCPNCGAPNNDYLDGFWLCGSIKSMPDDQNGHGTTCLIHQLTARDEEIAALKAEIEVANVQIADISQQFLRQEQRAIKAEAVLGRAKEYNERYFGMLPGYRLRGILDILSDIPAALAALTCRKTVFHDNGEREALEADECLDMLPSGVDLAVVVLARGENP